MTSLMDFCADAVTARRPSAAIMMLFSFFHGSIQISHKTRRKDTDFYGIMVHFPATFRIVWYYNAFEPYLSGTQAIISSIPTSGWPRDLPGSSMLMFKFLPNPAG